jgi:ubiquinone/menaquinone biosynthesis C-methylase UbiE
MENEEEARRLEIKTDTTIVGEQAKWAGIQPGMRVLDVGCGPGKTTLALHDLVQPGGQAIGIDFSGERIGQAERLYKGQGPGFFIRDLTGPLSDLGVFDFVWIRFVLEYFKKEARSIVQHVGQLMKPGAVICLIDLDHNCLNHFEMPVRLEKTLMDLVSTLEEKANFDPYAGRKLYSYLYGPDFEEIRVHVGAHHLIYGDLGVVDAYNWAKKMEIASRGVGFDFTRYPSGYEGYMEEFNAFFNDPGRFTYTPLIAVCGKKK